jgi:hypothetical protein
MPRTVDHIVDMHQLAQGRRKAGLPIWAETIDISDFWNDDIPEMVKRDRIVERIKASRWYRDRDSAGFDERGEAVENLAEADDEDEFNGWFDQLYDYWDYDRVWVKR